MTDAMIVAVTSLENGASLTGIPQQDHISCRRFRQWLQNRKQICQAKG